VASSYASALAWAGNPRYKADRQRSDQTETLLPLLRIPGITWISLQKGEAAEQLAALPGDVFVWDGSSRDRDLAETAALVATLDLVITTDTCIAHLAGAMGKPVWILLPHLADWRWMQETRPPPGTPRPACCASAPPATGPESYGAGGREVDQELLAIQQMQGKDRAKTIRVPASLSGSSRPNPKKEKILLDICYSIY
jgi:hypothetical protein